jgi:hypothetical protein
VLFDDFEAHGLSNGNAVNSVFAGTVGGIPSP